MLTSVEALKQALDNAGDAALVHLARGGKDALIAYLDGLMSPTPAPERQGPIHQALGVLREADDLM